MDYQQYAEQHNEAYEAFRKIYEKKVPSPVRPTVQKESIWTTVGLSVMVVASVIVSGSRTILEFGGGEVGISAFVMLEVGAIMYAYMRTTKYYDESRHAHVKNLLRFGMYLAFSVAIVANVHAVFRANGIEIPGADIVIFLLLAVSAPTLALIAGDALGMLLVTDRIKHRKADQEYQSMLEEYTSTMNKVWNRESAKWGVQISVQRPELSSPLDSPIVSNGQKDLPAASTLGHTKAPDASKTVRDYLIQNPEAVSLPARELASQLGVGKSTVANVQKQLKDMTHSTNGHGD